MSDLTLKQIEEVLDKKLEPINKKLGEHDGQFKSIVTKLGEHSDKLDALTLDMINVQKKTDLLPDLHSLIKDTREEVNKLDERIDRLETAA